METIRTRPDEPREASVPRDPDVREPSASASDDGPLYDADDVGRISDLLSEYADKMGQELDRIRDIKYKIMLAGAVLYGVFCFVVLMIGWGALSYTPDTTDLFVPALLMGVVALAGSMASVFMWYRSQSERREVSWGIRSNARRLETLVRTASQILEHKEHTAVRELELSLRLGEAEARLRQARVLVGTDDD
jgi:hypothetical protein